MKKNASAAFALLLLLPAGLRSEIKPGGYLSFSFIKGQSQSGYRQGSFQDALGGIFFLGPLNDNFDVAFEVRFGQDSKFEVEQASIAYKLGSETTLKLGLFLIPFGKYNESSRPFQTLLVEAPMNIAGAYPSSWRDIGLCLQGRWSFLNYSLYFGNGLGEKDGVAAGQLFKDINKDKAKGGRLGLIMGQGFEAGVSYYKGNFDAENKLRLVIKGADLAYVTEGYEIRGEVTRSTWKNGEGIANGKSEGFFILSAMNFGNIRPIVCYQKWDPGDFSGGYRLLPLEDGPEIPGARTRWAFGIRYAINPLFGIKAEYDINREKGTAVNNDVLRLQAALSF